MFDIDVVIPTAKQLDRLDNLVCQINTSLNSGVDTRVVILMEGEYPELMERLTSKQIEKIMFVKDAPQGNPSLPIKHCIENVELSEWMYSVGDDDCILPWGLKHLWEATQNIYNVQNILNASNVDKVSMVIGQTLGVSRDNHYDLSLWKIGHGIIPCHVSTALINVNRLRSLPKPWFEIDQLSDYLLIKRMSENFPYKIIPNVVHCQAFANVENLGPDFGAYFQKTYGHLL